jgi:hypothetical protein
MIKVKTVTWAGFGASAVASFVFSSSLKVQTLELIVVI